MVGAPQVMVLIQAVSHVFRAVFASALEISSMLAVPVFGGVLRSTMGRMLCVGNWTPTIPISTAAKAPRITVFQFVASGIKLSTTCAEPAEAFGSLLFQKRSQVKCAGRFFQKL